MIPSLLPLALLCAATALQTPIPPPAGGTRLHWTQAQGRWSDAGTRVWVDQLRWTPIPTALLRVLCRQLCDSGGCYDGNAVGNPLVLGTTLWLLWSSGGNGPSVCNDYSAPPCPNTAVPLTQVWLRQFDLPTSDTWYCTLSRGRW